MEDFELFPDEEEEAEAEEGSNRTFIILVAVFGGILAIGICAFIVWAVVIYPQIQKATTANAEIEQTAVVLTADAEAAADMMESTEVPEPTETPPPPTEEPTEIPPTATATPEEVAVVPTEEPAPTHRPTVTPKPTVTGGEGDAIPTTGIGAFGAGGIVVALMVILVAARRLRRAA